MKTPLRIPDREPEYKPNGKQGSLDPIRIIPFYVIVVLATVGLIARLMYLQLIQGDEYDAQARENRESKINIPSPRGVIYDRNGVLLASNVPSYNITLTSAYLPEDDIRLQELYRTISDLAGVPVNTPPLDANVTCGLGDAPPCGIADLVAANEGFPYNPIRVATDVPPEVAFVIREQIRTFPGVGVEVVPLREYPTGSLTAHIVGYMGPITDNVKDYYEGLGLSAARDKIGYAGIEAWMQDVLAGTNGYKFIEEDAAGLELRTIGEPVNPVPGSNVTLTIDVRLQQAAQAVLTKRINDINVYSNTTLSQNGVVIAMDPKTGEILAMVSWPAYDNQRFARIIPFEYYDQVFKDPARPLLNQAVSGQHAPGSVFKIIVAAGALQEGVIDPFRELFDPGQIVITNRYFPNDPGQARTVVCWKTGGHGDIAMVDAIAQSCSVYFYKIGGGYDDKGETVTSIDIEGIFKYGNMFGFHRRTGVELPGELRGLVPDRDYKRINIGENWSTGDTYIASIGQGYVLSTPLQVLDSVTPFLNSGWLVKPTLIKEVVDGEGNIVPVAQSYHPDTYRDFVPVGAPNSYQLSPFVVKYRDADPLTFDLIDPVAVSQENLDLVRRGMEEVYVTGTAYIAELEPIELEISPEQVRLIQAAGKSGTAEYCDNIAQRKQICKFGAWPRHAWFLGYAPAEDPEIAVVAFVYNGGEGSLTAGPIVQQVLQAFFELQQGDLSRGQ
ncbi:MAG TPA: penicillin-binding protein 2 [Anaerolineales bacterium]|nr:penicillin-binding protein 2 [Anaerolineales bacterium]